MANVKHQVAIVALVIALTGSLAACGNPVKDAVDKAVGNAVDNGVEKVIENAAGEDVDINVNTDGSAVDLPGDFPSGIPLPDGAKLTSTLSSPDSGWNLSYSMTDFAPADGLAEAYKADSSWETSYESISEGLKSWMFVNGSYQVVFLAVGDAGEYVMTMTVSPISQ